MTTLRAGGSSGRTGSVVAAKAVDEAPVAFCGAFGGSGIGDGAEEFAFFGGLAAGFFAVFGFAVEGLGDGWRSRAAG